MDIDAINSLSEAEKTKLMKLNACFYCKKPGHQANVCHKKKANQEGSSSNTSSNSNSSGAPHICITDTTGPPTMTTEDMVTYIKDNMDMFTEEVKYGFMDALMPKDFMQAQN